MENQVRPCKKDYIVGSEKEEDKSGQGHNKDMDIEAEMQESEADVEAILERTSRSFGRRRFNALYEAPEFVKRLNAFEEVTVGSTVVFNCQWKGFPKPTIHWYKDDEDITENNRYQKEADSSSGTLRLVIENTCKKDEGAYKCKAENQDGVASTTGYLSVTGDENRTLASQKKHQKETKKHDQDKDEAAEDKDSTQLRKVQSERTVSYAPHLRAIKEQKSLEEREEVEYSTLPPSPIQEFIDNFHRAKTWPAIAMGYGKRRDEDDVSSDSDTSVESQDLDRVSLDARISDLEDELNHNAGNSLQENSITSSTGALTNGEVQSDLSYEHNGNAVSTVIIPEIKVSKTKKRKSKPKVSADDTRLVYSLGTPCAVDTAQDINVPHTRLPKMDFCGAILDFLDSPWLYFLPITTVSSSVATATQMNPLIMITIVAVLSLICFRLLLHER